MHFIYFFDGFRNFVVFRVFEKNLDFFPCLRRAEDTAAAAAAAAAAVVAAATATAAAAAAAVAMASEHPFLSSSSKNFRVPWKLLHM